MEWFPRRIDDKDFCVIAWNVYLIDRWMKVHIWLRKGYLWVSVGDYGMCDAECMKDHLYIYTSAHTSLLLDTRIHTAPWVLRKYVSWFKSQDLVFHYAQNPLLKLNWSEMIASLQRENKMRQSKKQQKKYSIQQSAILFPFSFFSHSLHFQSPWSSNFQLPHPPFQKII